MTIALRNTKIFGRVGELKILKDAYDRVSQTGFGEIVLIGAPSGYGKTTLVNAFISENSVYHTVGKADEALRGVPYSAILKALFDFVSPGTISDLTTLRDDSSVTSPARARDRFASAIQSHARPTNPLVLFIDDLQWLDESSSQLIRYFSERGFRDMLIIGTYRSDTTSDFHENGLARVLGETAVRVTDVPLTTLAYEAVEDLILSQNYGDTSKQLARLVQSVASGNPFHIGLILNVLNRAEKAPDLAAFVSNQKNWSLYSLLAKLVAGLPEETRSILQYASCAGFTAEQTLLMTLRDLSHEELQRILEPAAELGLVKLDGKLHHFSHDSVREHINGEIQKDQAEFLHAEIAKSMLRLNVTSTDQHLAIAEQIVKANRNSLIFDVLDAAVPALFKASQIAKAVGSLKAALRYSEHGIALLSDNSAVNSYRWKLAELRCAILVDIHGSALNDREVERLLSQAESALERAKAIKLRSAVLILRGQFEDAIDTAIKGLADLDVMISRKPSQIEVAEAYESTIRAIRKLSGDNVSQQQAIADESVTVAMDLLATLQSSWFSNDSLKFLHVAKIVELSARHGVAEATCYGLAWSGVILASDYADYETALLAAETGVALSYARSFTTYRTSALVALDQVSVWRNPMSYALARAKEAFDHGKNSGDISMACYATNHIVSDLLAMGAPLSVVANEANRGLAMASSVGFQEVIAILQTQLAFANSLRNEHYLPGSIMAHATTDAKSQMSPLIFWGHLFDGIAAFHHGFFEDAARSLDQAKVWSWTTPAHIHIAELHFYSALNSYRNGYEPDKTDLEALCGFAVSNPLTFTNRVAFLEAEAALFKGDTLDALRLFEKSIQAAKSAELWHELALVHERSARVSLSEGLTFVGLEHIRHAHSYYRKWGAEHHVDRLECEFKGVFTPIGDRNADLVTELRFQTTDTFTDHIVVTAIKYSGALRGKLISVDKDEFLIVANTRIYNGASEVASETTRPTSKTLPTSILRHVVDSAQSLRYGHAVLEAGAPHEASLQDCPVRSVLCVPLINDDRVFSVLYLENNAVSDAFSLETEQAIELFVVAASKALVFKAELDDERESNLAQSHRDKSLLTARADLIKNSHITVLGGMAASIVHEVNQPLSAISTFANSGTRWLRQSTPQIEKAITNFSKIEESSLRASAIVSALRSLAKQAPANLEFVSFNKIVANVLEFIETDDRTNSLKLDCKLVENCTVFADAIQIQQVVYNLVTNALDAMEGRNAGRSLRISTELRDGSVVLSVSDNGSGIPAASRETIFDPFFTTKDRGLGMGLAICRSIAKVHGGDLLVGQSSAAGTTMIFRLPVHIPQ